MVLLGQSRELAREYGTATLQKTGHFQSPPPGTLSSQLPRLILDLEYGSKEST